MPKPEGKGHKCPWCKATTCYLHYKCNGCETYAENAQEPKRLGVEEIYNIICDYFMNYNFTSGKLPSYPELKKLAQAIYKAEGGKG